MGNLSLRGGFDFNGACFLSLANRAASAYVKCLYSMSTKESASPVSAVSFIEMLTNWLLFSGEGIVKLFGPVVALAVSLEEAAGFLNQDGTK